MNLFQQLFHTLVYQPQLNLIQLFFNITGDVGVAIILLALTVNLLLWPVFISSYVNSQKIRILQPKLKEIQEKYKGKQQELLQHTMAFNKKHKISSGSIFLVILVQLFFVSGLYFVINDVTKSTSNPDEAARLFNDLYTFTRNLPKTSFSNVAFGFIPINASTNGFIWLPILNAVFSFLYGMYSFRWAPQAKLPVAPKPKKDKEGEKPALDPEALQKSLEFNTIYVMPVVLFVANYSFPAGLNLYFATVSILALVRQVYITTRYVGHTDRLIAEIASSDPESVDSNPSNNSEIPADPADLASQPIITLIVKDKKPKIKNKKKK